MKGYIQVSEEHLKLITELLGQPQYENDIDDIIRVITEDERYELMMKNPNKDKRLITVVSLAETIIDKEHSYFNRWLMLEYIEYKLEAKDKRSVKNWKGWRKDHLQKLCQTIVRDYNDDED